MERAASPGLEALRGDCGVVEAEGEGGHLMGSLQEGDPGLEDGLGGVHDPAVDVTELLQGEQVGGMFGTVKNVGGRAVDWHGTRVGSGVGCLPAVEAEGFWFHRCGVLKVCPGKGRQLSRNRRVGNTHHGTQGQFQGLRKIGIASGEDELFSR